MNTGLRERRHESGLSQQRLAELADCSVAMVRALEGGLRPSTSAVLARIESVLADHGATSNPTGPTSDGTERSAA